MHPEDFKNYTKNMLPKYLKLKDREVVEHEYRMRHKNGKWLWLRSKELVFKRDNKNNAKQIFGIIENISEQKKITEALKLSEEQHRMIFESVTDCLIICDHNGNIIEVNPAANRLYGYTKKEFLKLSPAQLIHQEYHKVLEEFLKTVKNGNTFRGETVDIKKDGTLMNVEIIGTQVKIKGKPHIMAIIRDITQRKKYEKQLEETLKDLEESNKELEQFAYIASHDLQEPLRMVSSFLQLLVKRYENKLDDTAMEFIGFAVDGANRMKQLIKDLLQFSRVGTRGKEFELKDLKPEVNKALNNLKENIDKTGAEITVSNLPELYIDGTQIMQLFQNLISNALKFKGDKKPKIKISARKRKGYYEFKF
jgi:PAS domain S-box-containing protein